MAQAALADALCERAVDSSLEGLLSTCLTQLILGPYVVQFWSRIPHNSGGTNASNSTVWLPFCPGVSALNVLHGAGGASGRARRAARLPRPQPRGVSRPRGRAPFPDFAGGGRGPLPDVAGKRAPLPGVAERRGVEDGRAAAADGAHQRYFASLQVYKHTYIYIYIYR